MTDSLQLGMEARGTTWSASPPRTKAVSVERRGRQRFSFAAQPHAARATCLPKSRRPGITSPSLLQHCGHDGRRLGGWDDLHH